MLLFVSESIIEVLLDCMVLPEVDFFESLLSWSCCLAICSVIFALCSVCKNPGTVDGTQMLGSGTECVVGSAFEPEPEAR